MRKVSLRKNSGLGLVYTGETIDFNEVKYSKKKTFHFEELQPQLLNDHLQNVKVSYDKYYNLDVNKVFQNKNIATDLVSIEPDVAGIEYIKTKAVRCYEYNKILEIIHGSGTIIIQKFVSVSNQEIIISSVKVTDKLIIPAGYSYSIINTKNCALMALEFRSSKAKNRIVLDEMKGMSYYIIKKNAKKEIVKNPLYKIVDKFKKVDWKNYHKKYNITPKTPIFRQLLRKSDKFEWFFKPVEASDDTRFF